MNKSKIKVYIYYNITEKPWGGGNSFLKSFKKYIIANRSDELRCLSVVSLKSSALRRDGGAL